jgi:uncharacterized protein
MQSGGNMKIAKFLADVKNWGENSGFVKAVILVGSYAKGTNKADSDIDLCILSDDRDYIISNPDIFNQFGCISKINTEYYGACTSIRIWYENGFEVEYGIVEEDWIGEPLDAATIRVLQNGYKVIVDKNNYFDEIDPA